MIKYVPFFLFLAASVNAETFIHKGIKDVKLKVMTVDGVKFTNCRDNCDAKKAQSLSSELKHKVGSLYGNPASMYCRKTGGRSVILRDMQDRQYDFCQFEDESMISSWGLYESA